MNIQEQYRKAQEEEKVWEIVGQVAGQLINILERIAIAQESLAKTQEEALIALD